MHIAEHCWRLQSLSLHDIQGNTDSALLGIAITCTNLVDLTIAGLNVSDEGLINFCNHRTQLTGLNIHNCALTRKALSGVFSLKFLAKLAIYSVSGMTDVDTLQLARSLHRLEFIRLYVENTVSKATLIEFLHSCPMLRSLVIGSTLSMFENGSNHVQLEDVIRMSQGH